MYYIVTCIFIDEIVHILLDFTKENLYIHKFTICCECTWVLDFLWKVHPQGAQHVPTKLVFQMFEGHHNIIQIHNNLMWDWQYYVQYSHIPTECGNIVQNIVNPT